MTQLIGGLHEIARNYDALFCDLWGCLHDGVQALPGAVAALRKFRETGGRVILISNSPRPKPLIEEQLRDLGAPEDCWDDIATSGDSAQMAMMSGVVGRRVYHMGPARDDGFFTDLAPELQDKPPVARVPLDEAEGIVCTGLVDDETETPEEYRAELLYAKHQGLKLLCANPDIVVDRGGKRVWCAGALARLFSELGGESLYFGKPHPPIYDLARRRLHALEDLPDERILAIGDGAGTDLAGAMGEDLDCLFVTGGLAAEDTGTGPPPDGQPDLDRLSGFLVSERVASAYAIGYLR